MTIEILQPTSREEWLGLRKSTIGASEAAALLGVNPWMTPYELWARKSGLIPDVEETASMRRGKLLEPIAIELLREERPGWNILPNIIGTGGELYRDLEAGLSCTPDAFIDKNDFSGCDFSGCGICQIKTINQHIFHKDWEVDGEVQVPPYVAIQALQEMSLTGASWCCVEAIVGFDLEVHIIDIDPHPGILARIRTAVADFWRRVRENDPYQPDYGRDGDVIRDLYADDSGGHVDFCGNARIAKLAARHLALKEIESAAYCAEKERKIIDAEIIEALGNAQSGTIDGLLIEAKTLRRFYKPREAFSTSSRPVKIRQRSMIA